MIACESCDQGTVGWGGEVRETNHCTVDPEEGCWKLVFFTHFNVLDRQVSRFANDSLSGYLRIAVSVTPRMTYQCDHWAGIDYAIR